MEQRKIQFKKTCYEQILHFTRALQNILTHQSDVACCKLAWGTNLLFPLLSKYTQSPYIPRYFGIANSRVQESIKEGGETDASHRGEEKG